MYVWERYREERETLSMPVTLLALIDKKRDTLDETRLLFFKNWFLIWFSGLV